MMIKNNPLPILITFDGEARSGKGTIVQATKDYLRDQLHHKVMLIDAGQVFRVLVVAGTRAGTNLDSPDSIDAFLSNEKNVEGAVKLVKDVYHMSKEERQELLYTNEVGRSSAKFGARPLSQVFKDNLLRKWLRDARSEGFDTVLLDGRALLETGSMLESEGLCDFRMGLYFICHPVIGARRTLGFADRPYEELSQKEKDSVDVLVQQIKERDESDRNRSTQPLVRPLITPSVLPEIQHIASTERPIYLIDTSTELTKEQMSAPIERLVAEYILSSDQN